MGDATVYFLVMVAAQVYIQPSLRLMMVQPLVPFYPATRWSTTNTPGVGTQLSFL